VTTDPTRGVNFQPTPRGQNSAVVDRPQVEERSAALEKALGRQDRPKGFIGTLTRRSRGFDRRAGAGVAPLGQGLSSSSQSCCCSSSSLRSCSAAAAAALATTWARSSAGWSASAVRRDGSTAARAALAAHGITSVGSVGAATAFFVLAVAGSARRTPTRRVPSIRRWTSSPPPRSSRSRSLRWRRGSFKRSARRVGAFRRYWW